MSRLAPSGVPPRGRGPARSAALLLMGLVQLYRYSFSYFLGRNCRFSPTCSEYALAALDVHGPLRGVWLAVRRIGRCHPWGGSGYDPVPPAGGAGSEPGGGEKCCDN